MPLLTVATCLSNIGGCQSPCLLLRYPSFIHSRSLALFHFFCPSYSPIEKVRACFPCCIDVSFRFYHRFNYNCCCCWCYCHCFFSFFLLCSIYFCAHITSERCIAHGVANWYRRLDCVHTHTLNAVSLLRQDCVKLSRKLTRLSGNLSAPCYFVFFFFAFALPTQQRVVHPSFYLKIFFSHCFYSAFSLIDSTICLR